MASDSREEGAVTVDLPAELDEWLDDRAATLGVDREDVVVQLLASYHAAASLDGDLDTEAILGEDAADVLDVEEAVGDVLDAEGEELVADAVATAVERELAERLAGEVEAAVEEHLPTVTDAVEGRLEDRIDENVAERIDAAVEDHVTAEIEETIDERVAERLDGLEAAFQEKIVDVRERVIQVKKEADGKAPADHDHAAFERLEDLESRIEDLAASIDQLEGSVEGVREELDADVDGVVESQDAIEDRLSDTEDKLKRVAWVVSDLKDEAGGRDAYEQAVARIKHAAAQEGVTAADCERCGESVDVALLTDPECPHCSATVSDVRPSGGIFRKKATLVAAAQLESGEE